MTCYEWALFAFFIVVCVACMYYGWKDHQRFRTMKHIVTKHGEEVYVERLCQPPRIENGKTVLSDVLCRVYPT